MENLDFGKKIEKMLFGAISRKKNLEELIKNENSLNKIYKKYIDEFKSILKDPKALRDDEKFFQLFKKTDFLGILVEKIIRENQPGGDPTSPKADFANSLHEDIAGRVCASPLGEVDYYRLHYYTTIDTHLDYHNQTDFFFEKYDLGEDDQLVLARKLNVDFKLRKDEGSFQYFEDLGDNLIIYMKSEDGIELDFLYGKLNNFEYDLKQEKNTSTGQIIKDKIKETKNKIKEFKGKYFKEWNNAIANKLV